MLQVKVSHTTPGHPWENAHAESLIGTLRAYLYPHTQRQKSVAGVQRVYTDYYNHRVHWDEDKTPLGKLGSARGRSLPDDFQLSLLATGKRFTRIVDGQGRISWKRYRLYIRVELKKEKVEVREFFDSLVITYQSGAVVTYACSHERSQVASVSDIPVFHDHPGIEPTKQLELFDISQFKLCYVSRRAPFWQCYPACDGRYRIEEQAFTQLWVKTTVFFHETEGIIPLLSSRMICRMKRRIQVFFRSGEISKEKTG